MKIYKIFNFFIIFLLSFFSLAAILTIDATIENIIVERQLVEFMNKGVEVGKHSNFTFYEVVIEEELTTPVLSFTESGNPYLATPGDIFVLRESSLTSIPLAAEFITYYFGGHSGIVYDEDFLIETTGMELNPELNKVIKNKNDVFFRPERVSSVGLRVKATEEEIESAVNFAESTIGLPYNYSFVFNRKNSFYCTDLVSRSYGKEAGLNFNLDKDGIATSCNDLIISKDTFITYYLVYEGYNKHLYYAVNK